MSSQVQKEIKLTLITEIPAREFYIPFPFSPLPDLLYYLAGDEDENVVNVYQAEKVTN